MKRGRPTKIDKARNRQHSLILDAEAEFYFRKISQERGTGWAKTYWSEAIKRDFKGDGLEYAIFELNAIQEKIKEKEKELDYKSQEIIKKKQERINRITQIEEIRA